EAGAITTGSAAVAERCRVLRDHGQRERYIHVTGDGGNARLDALQAVVLSAKLQRLEAWNDARRRIAALYCARLQGEELVLEAETLRDAGYEVAVLAPAAPQESAQEVVRGVSVRRYARGPEGGGRRGYLREYAHAWRHLGALVRRLRGERPIDVLHACSPPD